MKIKSIEVGRLSAPTRLYADYLSGKTGDLIGNGFLDNDAPARIVSAIDNRAYRRQELYEIIRDGNIKLDSAHKTLENIELLKNPQTLCVFAGQQTGVMIGPMYTIYKALAAVKLAEKYQELLGHPVIPCFWMATDDHDFKEVHSAYFLNRPGELVDIAFNPVKDYGGIPIANMTLDEGVKDFVEAVGDALLDTEFKPELMAFLKEIYRPGMKLAEAFARLFNRFLGDYGIVLVDPNFPGLKELFKDVLATEIQNHKQTFEIYIKRSEQLLKLGYHNQVQKNAATLNVFYHNPARLNINVQGENYVLENSREQYSRSWFLDKVDKWPQQFSPNVLLRPIAQCSAFPTLCQIAGPSELAYYIQLMPLFDFFRVPEPIIFPRPGMTLIEPHIGKTLSKYGLEIDQLKNNPDFSISNVIERMFPSDAALSLISIQERLKSDLDKIAETLQKTDPEGHQLAGNLAKRFDYEMNEIRKKLKATNKKRHDDVVNQIKKAYGYLFPEGKLQERTISPVYFANKFGPRIFEEIYNGLDIDNHKHVLLEL